MKDICCEKRSYAEKACTHEHHYNQLILPLEGELNIKTHREFVLDQKHLFFLPPSCSHSFYGNRYNKFIVMDVPRNAYTINLEEKAKGGWHQVIDKRWEAIKNLLTEEIKYSNVDRLRNLSNYICDTLTEEALPVSIKFIQDNYKSSIDIKTLAKMENYNLSYYSQWFIKKTGVTPLEYIQRLRLNHAKELLKYTDMNLLYIANEVGYEHQSSLTRVFKQQFGTTPSQYRTQTRIMGKRN